MFKTVVMSSAPYGGPPALPFRTANALAQAAAPPADPNAIYADLAKLTPPRKHYQRYYQTAEANENIWHAKQGLHAFLRAYYHMKSADWRENRPRLLAARTAADWAKLPRYYVMDLDKGMAEQVASEMPSAAEIAANTWLPDSELRVYTEEYGRTGFQAGLNGYRGSPRTHAAQGLGSAGSRCARISCRRPPETPRSPRRRAIGATSGTPPYRPRPEA